MRTFIAIELPQALKDALSEIQNKLKTTLPKISWVKPQNLHLTLKFIGEISPKQLNNIKQMITEIATATADFKIKLETLGVFPNIRSARIIWIGNNQLPLPLKNLVDQIETKIAELGKPKEDRPFLAHVTVGRIKTHINPSILEDEINKINNKIGSKNWEFDAGRITLFESVLGKLGPTYTALKEANFRIN